MHSPLASWVSDAPESLDCPRCLQPVELLQSGKSKKVAAVCTACALYCEDIEVKDRWVFIGDVQHVAEKKKEKRLNRLRSKLKSISNERWKIAEHSCKVEIKTIQGYTVTTVENLPAAKKLLKAHNSMIELACNHIMSDMDRLKHG